MQNNVKIDVFINFTNNIRKYKIMSLHNNLNNNINDFFQVIVPMPSFDALNKRPYLKNIKDKEKVL